MIVRSCSSQGTLPAYLAAVIIGRDVFLVGASLAERAKALGWKRVSAAEFFRIASHNIQVGTAESYVQPHNGIVHLPCLTEEIRMELSTSYSTSLC